MIVYKEKNPLTVVALVSKFEIEKRKDENIYRVNHYYRLPQSDNKDFWFHDSGKVFKTIEDCKVWIKEQSDDQSRQNIIKIKELKDKAMAEFYSDENRNKYLYNE